ncbi:MAG: hypothetical protein HYY44_04725, partial [Deltaproteobacteria bacterium]|nr:hypothetical protein [Deltaproteobacteria bacterium]
EAASGFYARILATAGLGGGLEVRGADVEPYFDWEAMRITAALGGYW